MSMRWKGVPLESLSRTERLLACRSVDLPADATDAELELSLRGEWLAGQERVARWQDKDWARSEVRRRVFA